MHRIDRAFQIAAVIGLLLVVMPLALPHDTRASEVLQNFMHVPVFALVAIVALRTVQAHRSSAERPVAAQYALALTVAAALGAASEIAQIPGPREASIKDWIVDVASAATALAFVRWREAPRAAAARQRLGLAIAVAAGSLFLLAPALHAAIAYGYRYQQLPDLFRYHGARLDAIDTYFLLGEPANREFRALPEPWRQPGDPVGIRLVLPAIQWPGLTLDEPYPDWRGYQTLLVDLTNPQGHPLEFTLRIHDRRHNKQLNDRFNGVLTLAPNSRQVVRIPLSDVQRAPAGRSMDMGHIAGLILFRTSPGREGEAVYVTRMALEK
jgi:hypothetical protein